MAAAMVMAGAYAAATELVRLDALVAALPEALPSYRRQHVGLNERALRAGYATVATPIVAAWAPAEVGRSAC